MEQVYSNVTRCCGCAKCMAVCPTGAIIMQEKGGHLYPVINQTLCIDCKKCERLCAFKSPNKQSPLAALAVKHSDDVRMLSSSGGIFTALSDVFLENGGTVYGADFDESMHLRHVAATTTDTRNRMRGAKYIQSDIRSVYASIKADLDTGRSVLFTGTPCQTDAVRSYCGDHDRLFTLDLICHGVPSSVMWERFIEYLEHACGKKVAFYSFRNKDIAWRRYSGKVTFTDGSVLCDTDMANAYIELFRYDLAIRPACTACPYADIARTGDITIGDFWGIEAVLPNIDDNKGISAVFINSQKGQYLFDRVKDALSTHEVTPDDIARKQLNLRKPSVASPLAEQFAVEMQTLPFETILKKYTRVGFKRRAKDFIKKLLGR